MGQIIFVFYTVTAPVLITAYLIFLAFTPRRSRIKRLNSELDERLAINIPEIPQNLIWIHAASMGEVKAVSEFAKRLSQKLNTDFFITTSTATGKKEAVKLTPYVSLVPIDFYPLISKFTNKLNPKLLIIAETEIWPAMFVNAFKKNIPVYFVNARISKKTLKLYETLGPLTRFIFKGVKKVLCQSKTDMQRYETLLMSENKVYNTGNIKYDQTQASASSEEEIKSLFDKIKWKDSHIFTAGSTHTEEEPVIVQAFKDSKNTVKDLKMILVPRHLEQMHRTIKLLRDNNLDFTIYSGENSIEKETKSDILLINKTGILQQLYRYSHICFVGGTLDNTGGHNLLEPSLFSKPVLFGPNYKTAQIAGEELINEKGGFIVKSSRELSDKLNSLLSDKEFLSTTGNNSFKALKNLQGATERTLNLIP